VLLLFLILAAWGEI
jgi:hypothetical protein